jgi:hypothetical protein
MLQRPSFGGDGLIAGFDRRDVSTVVAAAVSVFQATVRAICSSGFFLKILARRLGRWGRLVETGESRCFTAVFGLHACFMLAWLEINRLPQRIV